jgi:hypothetical protein
MVNEFNDPVDFKALAPENIERCAKHRRCGICGGKVRGELAFIGPVQRLDVQCFADAWMHLECARLAMVQCPFLAGRKDWRDEAARRDPHMLRYSEGMRLFTARDGRAHRDARRAWHFEAIGELTEVTS